MDAVCTSRIGVAILNYDVVIVGAGVAGLTAACALAQQTSLAIAVLEAKPLHCAWNAADYHHRVSALALSSKRILQQLKVWQEIAARRVSPFSHIAVWDAAAAGELQFDSADIGESELGYIVENNLIQQALLHRLENFPQVRVMTSCQLSEFKSYEDKIEITTNFGIVTGKLAIAADGAQSWLRGKAGINMSEQEYGHDAIVTAVRTTKQHAQTARQVFLPTGPLAFLPLLETNLSSIVWSVPPEMASELLALTDEEFKTRLSAAFSCRLGDVVEVAKRFSFPLKRQRAQRYIAARVALIGDAAHTLHPLAGQGLNIGLLDAASIAEIIVDNVKQSRDVAHFASLRRYERWRKGENQLMLGGVDWLASLFGSDKKSVQTLRAFGCNVTNQFPLLRNFFIRFAVGSRSGLPDLAKDEI